MTNLSQKTSLELVQDAKVLLSEKRQSLSENAKADKGVIKAATSSVHKAEKAYADALRNIELPTSKVELCTVEESTKEREVVSKKVMDVIIGVTAYNMHTTKTAGSFGMSLLSDSNLEKTSLFIAPADLLYTGKVELKDLNGNVIPVNTPNVYVPLDTADTFWRWAAYHSYNIEAEVSETEKAIIPNVRIKQFESLQDLAKYTGTNIVLSRGMNGTEKAGIAALATQDEFFTKVFDVAKAMNANISVVTKYYNLGKTLPVKVWNNAMLGNMDEKFEYDLTIGDRIIETLNKKGFEEKFMRERYLIDAFTKLTNHKPEINGEKLGIEKALDVVNALSTMQVTGIQQVTERKVDEIYSYLLGILHNQKQQINEAA